MEQQEHKGVSPPTLKFFVRHVASAARGQKERDGKISELDSQVSSLKRSALSGKPAKKKVEKGFDELQRRIKDLINEERTIILNQKKEEEIIEELKERLDILEEKVHGLSHVHSLTSEEHMRRIQDLHKKVNNISSGRERQAEEASGSSSKEEKPESSKLPVKGQSRKIVEHNPQLVISTMKELGRKKNHIEMLEEMISNAEKKHAELRKKRIQKKHLDSLKDTIEKHKKALRSIKRQ